MHHADHSADHNHHLGRTHSALRATWSVVQMSALARASWALLLLVPLWLAVYWATR